MKGMNVHEYSYMTAVHRRAIERSGTCGGTGSARHGGVWVGVRRVRVVGRNNEAQQYCKGT